MKRVFTLLLITFICFSANSVYALSINNETNYTRYAQNRAKYYPQNTFANRYRRQQRQNYIFSPQYLAKNEKPKKNITKNSTNTIITEKNKIKEISDKLAKIEEMHSRIGYFIKIDELEFTCELKKDLKEIDSIGHLREPINVINEEIPFTKGIEKLIKYVELKNAKDKSAEGYIKNDFKCPILYKNFQEEIIPSNKAILCEIKGGFAIKDVAKQIEKRIKFIHNCLFNEGEKPEYFIGIVNVYSKNVDKLKKFSGLQLEFEDKVLIVSAVDYEYKGMNISYEINTDYLLFKKMDSLKQEIKDEIKEEIRKEMAAQKQEIKDEISGINTKIDKILEILKKMNPKLVIPENKQNIHSEEKKNND